MNRRDYDPEHPHPAVVFLGVIGTGFGIGLLALLAFAAGAAIFSGVVGQ
ncbi:hypothetical protein ACF1AJ_20640 [Leifsonia sp. NPDC014704]